MLALGPKKIMNRATVCFISIILALFKVFKCGPLISVVTDICHRGCANLYSAPNCTMLYSAAYGTVHYEKPWSH